jgi:hypothetical protein
VEEALRRSIPEREASVAIKSDDRVGHVIQDARVEQYEAVP